MARVRTIKPEAWADLNIGGLSLEARLLWVVLITASDCYGVFDANPGAIWAHGYRHRHDHLPLIEGWLTELEEDGRIGLYLAGDERYGFFPNWADHQKVDRPSKVRLPQPPRELVERLTRDSREPHAAHSRASKTPEIPEARDTVATPSRGSRARTMDQGPWSKDQGSVEVEDAGAPARALPISLDDPLEPLGMIDNGNRRFDSAWMTEEAEVRALLAEVDDVEVQRQVVARIVDQAPTWEQRGVLFWVREKMLPAVLASRTAKAYNDQARGMFSPTESPAQRRAREADDVLLNAIAAGQAQQ